MTAASPQHVVKPASRSSPGDELEMLIRARYPIIYVVTWEERRVEEHAARIAQSRGKTLYIWTLTSGLWEAGSRPTGRKGKVADPVESLDTVIEHKQPAIYLFKDLHRFMGENAANAAVVRKLREVAAALSDSYKSLIITAPVIELARDLEKDVTVLDYPLPGPKEFSCLLDRIARDVAENTDISLEIDESSREKLIQSALGLTLQEAENVFAKTIISDGKLDASDISMVFSEKQQIIRKSGVLEYCETGLDLEQVGGLERLKDWLTKRSLAFAEKAQRFGLPAPKGVLLVGVQGCGKTLCAKAVSSLWNMPLLRFDMGRMFSSLVGSSEENVRRAIAVAESIAPVVLWADEIDKAFAGSQDSGGTDGGTTARVMSTFLTWLSEKQRPVFVIATANDISHLPPELLRKGRMDEIFFVDLPNAEERRVILQIHIAKRARDPKKFELDRLVQASDGFSGAELEQAVISGLYDAFYVGSDLDTATLLASIEETVPLSRTMSEKISALRGWADGRARFASIRQGETTVEPRRKLEF
jgi:SpoVK/Ycf46/Vps4 family AAA+-type ATPase